MERDCCCCCCSSRTEARYIQKARPRRRFLGPAPVRGEDEEGGCLPGRAARESRGSNEWPEAKPKHWTAAPWPGNQARRRPPEASPQRKTTPHSPWSGFDDPDAHHPPQRIKMPPFSLPRVLTCMPRVAPPCRESSSSSSSSSFSSVLSRTAQSLRTSSPTEPCSRLLCEADPACCSLPSKENCTRRPFQPRPSPLIGRSLCGSQSGVKLHLRPISRPVSRLQPLPQLPLCRLLSSELFLPAPQSSPSKQAAGDGM